MAPLRAGEVSLHHVKLVHGSAPNGSGERRIGLAIRYIPPEVRQLKTRDSAAVAQEYLDSLKTVMRIAGLTFPSREELAQRNVETAPDVDLSL